MVIDFAANFSFDHLQAVGSTWQRTPTTVSHQRKCRCQGTNSFNFTFIPTCNTFNLQWSELFVLILSSHMQLELRKKQFHVLLSTIQELQQTLESEWTSGIFCSFKCPVILIGHKILIYFACNKTYVLSFVCPRWWEIGWRQQSGEPCWEWWMNM